LIPKNQDEKFSSGFLQSEFLGGVNSYASTSFIVALSPGHSNITRFRPWSTIATENHFDSTEKFQNFSDDWHR